MFTNILPKEGTKVRHHQYGEGTIKDILDQKVNSMDSSKFAVNFSIGEKKFLFPNALEQGHITLLDEKGNDIIWCKPSPVTAAQSEKIATPSTVNKQPAEFHTPTVESPTSPTDTSQPLSENNTETNSVKTLSSQFQVESDPKNELRSMIGLSSVKEMMQQITAHCFIRQRKAAYYKTKAPFVANMLFLGNPGTGKTTVADLVAQNFKELGLMKKGQVVKVNRSDLVAEYCGQSAIKTRKVFESALDGILFVDEAYSLYHGDTDGRAGDTYTREVIDTLTTLMSEHIGRCCVIFAGYEEEMNFMLDHSNPGLRERFPFTIHFEDYDAKELTDIFVLKMETGGLEMEVSCKQLLNEHFKRICAGKKRHFANGRLVDTLLQNVLLAQELRLMELYQSKATPNKNMLFTLIKEDFESAISSTKIERESLIKSPTILRLGELAVLNKRS